MSTFQINLHEAIYSLSDALDLVGVTPHSPRQAGGVHGRRGGSVSGSARATARQPVSSHRDYSGVSKTAVHAKLRSWSGNSKASTAVLAQTAGSCALLRDLAPIVRYHHTHWPALQALDLPDAVKRAANCIYMVDRVDILTLKYLTAGSDILLGKDDIRQQIASHRGVWFSPELVDAFLEISESEAFWFMLESDHVNGYVATWLAETSKQDMAFEDLSSLMHIFSSIVDAKSSFTKEHSDGVASLGHAIWARLCR